MNICVFCASFEVGEPYATDAKKVGKLLGERGHGLVYGGSTRGLMGAMSDEAIRATATTYSILPSWWKQTHTNGSHLIEVESMLARKEKMIAMSDGFLVLPGGWGTLDELFEVLVSSAIGQRVEGKAPIPIVLLNTADFYTPLMRFMEGIQQKGFVSGTAEQHYALAETPEEAIQILEDKTI